MICEQCKKPGAKAIKFANIHLEVCKDCQSELVASIQWVIHTWAMGGVNPHPRHEAFFERIAQVEGVPVEEILNSMNQHLTDSQEKFKGMFPKPDEPKEKNDD